MRMLKVAVVVLTALLVAWSADLFFAGEQTRTTAKAFLVDFSQLEPGRASFADLKALAQKYKSEVNQGEMFGGASPCSTASCRYNFKFYNRLQFSFPVNRTTTNDLSANFDYENGKLVSRSISLNNFYAPKGTALSVNVEEFDTASPTQSALINEKKLPNGSSYVLIRIGADTPELEKNQFYAFNLGRLGTVEGYKNTFEMLPSIRSLGKGY